MISYNLLPVLQWQSFHVPRCSHQVCIPQEAKLYQKQTHKQTERYVRQEAQQGVTWTEKVKRVILIKTINHQVGFFSHELNILWTDAIYMYIYLSIDVHIKSSMKYVKLQMP